MVKKLWVLAGLFSAVFVTNAQAQGKKDRLAGLDGYISQAMKDWNMPGLAVAIVKGDSVVYLKGFDNFPINNRKFFFHVLCFKG